MDGWPLQQAGGGTTGYGLMIRDRDEHREKHHPVMDGSRAPHSKDFRWSHACTLAAASTALSLCPWTSPATLLSLAPNTSCLSSFSLAPQRAS